jgi:hypothetical protein
MHRLESGWAGQYNETSALLWESDTIGNGEIQFNSLVERYAIKVMHSFIFLKNWQIRKRNKSKPKFPYNHYIRKKQLSMFIAFIYPQVLQ